MTDAQSDATRLVVVRIVLADADSSVDEGTLAQTLSVGQADTALVVLVALRIQADIVEVGGTVVGDLIAEAAVEAFGLVAGACLSFPFGLAITQTGAEVTQFHADGGGQFVATLQVVDLATVERLIADTEEKPPHSPIPLTAYMSFSLFRLSLAPAAAPLVTVVAVASPAP